MIKIDGLKPWSRYLLIVFIRNFLKIFWFLGVKNNRILAWSFRGKQYSCSPKYITEYIQKNSKEKYEIIWAFKNPKEFNNLKDNNITIVKYNSVKFLYYAITAKVIIVNSVALSYVPVRKNQFVLSTWHGGGAYKKVGLDVISTKPTRFHTKLLERSLTKMISSCQSFSNAFHTAYLIPYNKFINCGMPRNDILINHNRDDLIGKVKQYYHIPLDAKIVLYAPTFRSQIGTIEGDFHDNDCSIDIQRLRKALIKRFGGKWFIMYRAHYYLSDNLADGTIIDATNYPDMQELLYVVNALITDYSSSMWDFSFTYRPCFLFATDLQEYEKDRDFYTPIETWPFPLAQNNDELEDNILNFDNEKYKKDIDYHHQKLGSFESGKACETVCNMIFDLNKKRPIDYRVSTSTTNE